MKKTLVLAVLAFFTAVNIGASSAAPVETTASLRLSNFAKNSTQISVKDKVRMSNFALQNPVVLRVQCIGYLRAGMKQSEKALIQNRAKRVCTESSKLFPNTKYVVGNKISSSIAGSVSITVLISTTASNIAPTPSQAPTSSPSPTPTTTTTPRPAPSVSAAPTPKVTPLPTAAPKVAVAVAPSFYVHPRPSLDGSGNIKIDPVQIATGTPSPVMSYRWFECFFTHGDNTQLRSGSSNLPSDCSLIAGQTSDRMASGSFNAQRNIIIEATATNSAGKAIFYSATENSRKRPSEYLIFEATGEPVTGGWLTARAKWDGIQGQSVYYQWYTCTAPHEASLTLASDCRSGISAGPSTDYKMGLHGEELYGPNSPSSSVGKYYLAKIHAPLTYLPAKYTNTVGPIKQKQP